MAEKNSNIGFVGLPTLILIALKLCGVINLPWVWVLCPVWITAGLVAIIFVIVGILWVLGTLFR